MAWNQTPQSSNLHKNKQQQNSLQTDSSRDSFESCSSGATSKSPKSRNVMNYERYMQPPHQLSDPGFYLSRSLKSPKASSNQTFEFELSSPAQYLRSSPNRHFYEDSTTTDSAPATLTSPLKKYEYNAVSSNVKSENSAGEFLVHLIADKSNIILLLEHFSLFFSVSLRSLPTFIQLSCRSLFFHLHVRV